MTTRSATGNVGVRTAVAPGAPARQAAGTRSRVCAGVALFACLASAGWLGSYAWRHRVNVNALGAPPFKISDAAWRSVLTVATTTDRACPPSVPVVILYVSSSCLHCQAELRRWSDLVQRHAPELACTGIAVVATPNKAVSLHEWLPVQLASMLLWDHDATVGRALEVRLVPLAAYVTSKGTVSAKVIGETSEASTGQHLADLRRFSDGERGVH
jgi:hypothetical protein